MTRLFLDTNIVVDLLDRREPFCHDAVRLFTMAYNKQVKLIVSPMTFATASFLLRKHVPRACAICCPIFGSYPVSQHPMSARLTTRWPQFKDFEDAMQYYTALRAKSDAIITRNGKDFTASKLPVLTPSEFFSKIDSK